MYASNYHSYTHLIRALGIVREPTVCWFVTSEYPGIHDIGLPSFSRVGSAFLITPRMTPIFPLNPSTNTVKNAVFTQIFSPPTDFLQDFATARILVSF